MHLSICLVIDPSTQHTHVLLYTNASPEIEAVGAEPHDELVAELVEFVVDARLVDTTLRPDDLHHVSYTVVPLSQGTKTDASPSPRIVTCRVASVINEVGLKIWEAGWYLTEYIVTHPSVFANQTVLELGAGVGFTGLALAAAAAPKRVILSDYSAMVMQNLRYNAEVNAPTFRCPVDVVTLDWETWDPSVDATDLRPDILLAGDCVYDVAIFPALVRVLQVFLDAGAGSGESPAPPRRAIFAATIRNQLTFQAFLDQLARFAIAYDDITAAALETMGPQRFPYDNRDQIRLCVLTRASAPAAAE